MNLLDDLEARGLIHDSTDRAALATRLAEGAIRVYCGFDPTAASLHLGHLVPLLTLRRFQDAGHQPIALAGGATGMVGDPSGRSEERNLLSDEVLAANLEGITAQLGSFLDFSAGPAQAQLVDNREWTAPMSAIEFLRDIGKHVTVNQMLAKESVKNRIEGEHGLSFTEFSYMLLQANDFRHLFAEHRCELQVGGSDQWGNITAGIDLIRRTTGQAAYGLTCPLLTRSDGAKFGKTADGAVWLDPALTSPYQLFQYFMQVPDDDVEQLLLRLTLMPVADARGIAADHAAAPERRAGQRALAHALVEMLHGSEAAEAAEAAAGVLFGGDPAAAPPAALEAVAHEAGSSAAPTAPTDIVEVLVAVGLASSKGDARRTVEQGGAYVNGHRASLETSVGPDDLLHGRFTLLRKGKKGYHVLVAG